MIPTTGLKMFVTGFVLTFQLNGYPIRVFEVPVTRWCYAGIRHLWLRASSGQGC